MLRDMSYRYRLPLSLAAAAIFTTLVTSLIVAWHAYQNVRLDLVDNGTRLNNAMAHALLSPLVHDDVWEAYSILRGNEKAGTYARAKFVLLDAQSHIFASSDPQKLPVAISLMDAAPELAAAMGLENGVQLAERVVELERLPDQLLFTTPLVSDGVPIGNLVLLFPRQLLWQRFAAIIKQGALSVLLVLAVIMPVGWFAGQRIVIPLTRLASCMVRMREEDLRKFECHAPEGNDEIGRLSMRFRELLAALNEKQALEQQMITSERLAAVGRLAAGVAHEINNPLGGMLLAIDTLRKRGIEDLHTQNALSLLERGLQQIQSTISALLVEGRHESHPLTGQDIDDTRMLVSAELERPDATILWENAVEDTLPLPSTPVRQAIINLLLNAAQAIPNGGQIHAKFHADESSLVITVFNDGDEIDPVTRDHLFEPYFSQQAGGSGLGLWVTHQIVQQLSGKITVESQPHGTLFRVELPIGDDLGKHCAA
jgi:signal transduction histidine kinase